MYSLSVLFVNDILFLRILVPQLYNRVKHHEPAISRQLPDGNNGQQIMTKNNLALNLKSG